MQMLAKIMKFLDEIWGRMKINEVFLCDITKKLPDKLRNENCILFSTKLNEVI